ncbi:hypothetical protein FBU59_000231 [Linderina macrospora]|uniref:Uncharacterized protein n=1 Tax=Linderina macrospora TaxID=4868 RepID=A0ACC1JHI9_9FUNG|nr:hypothetical protein FBU59_000231 [Linderina macrospora]
MSEPAVFDICFPSHITRIPICRPGATIAGAVVLKLTSPLVASHLMLRFYGVERVRRTPVAVQAVSTEKRQVTMMSQQMVMDKEFFRRELLLWGEPSVDSTKIIPCDSVHRFHFSFTMPYVNMPTPRQTPDVEISYSLEASLFTEVFDQQRDEKVLKDIYKTPIKSFLFEPIIQEKIVHGQSAAPQETIVAMRDVESKNSQKTHLALHVFHPTPSFLPGETIDLLILAPAGKKINGATYQLKENVRCRKSSAPIIDESDVPILWKYSVDIAPVRDMSFIKLSKTNITQEIGMLGHFMFTSQATTTDQPNLLGPVKTNDSLQGRKKRRGEFNCVVEDQRSQKTAQPSQTTPLSPLAETQELMAAENMEPASPVTLPPPPRARTASLSGQPPLNGPTNSTASVYHNGSFASSPHPPTYQQAIAESRMSKSISGDMDDAMSDRSSISDAISIRYAPGKVLSAGLQSLTRGVSTYGGLTKDNQQITAVPLGSLLSQGSYRFAKIKLTLPQLKDMSPVSSVFLDFEYTIDIMLTLGGSFGTSRRVSGKLPLKIVTVRSAAKMNGSGTNSSSEGSRSLHDSLSCLNLSIAHSEEQTTGSNGSPATTLTEFPFDSNGAGADSKLVGDCYPCLQSFLQDGLKIPMPDLEVINIGNSSI